MYICTYINLNSGSRTDNSNSESLIGICSETTIESTHPGQLLFIYYSLL